MQIKIVLLNYKSRLCIIIKVIWPGTGLRLKGDIMKRLLLVPIFVLICAMFTACGGSAPEYLVMEGSDNGFVAARRNYLGITDKTTYKLSSGRFDRLAYGDDPDYESVKYEIYSFELSIPSSSQSSWVCTANEYNPEGYDEKALFADLAALSVTSPSELYVLVTTFGEYRILSVSYMNGNNVLGQSCALFKDSDIVTLPKGMDLYEIRSVYRMK